MHNLSRGLLVGWLWLGTACTVRCGSPPPIPDAGTSWWAPQPVEGHEGCATAWPIVAPGGQFRGDTRGFADDVIVRCGDNRPHPDVAFRFELADRSWVRFETPSSSFNGALAVVPGSCQGPELGCADNPIFFDHRPSLTLTLDAGSYVLWLDGSNDGTHVIGSTGASGTYVLESVLLPLRSLSSGSTCSAPDSLAGSASLRGSLGASPLAVQLDLSQRSDVLWSADESSSALAVELRRDSCEGELLGTFDKPKATSLFWRRERLTLDPGTYVLRLPPLDADGGLPRFQLDVVVAPFR